MKIITCEQVSNGHPDKICDQIADAIVTDVLQNDKNARVAIEVLIKDRHVVIAGELTSKHNPNYRSLVRDVFNRIGFDKLGYYDLLYAGLEIQILVNQQSPDIALGVDKGGAGDQGMMYGYATNETVELLPIPFMVATKFLEILKNHPSKMFRADAKAQVSFDYDSGKITTFLCSVQHSPDVEVSDFRHVIEGIMVLAACEYGLNVNVEETAGKIMNDNMGDSEFYNFLLAAYTQMYENLASDGSIYVFHADTEGLNFRKAFKEAGFYLSGCCIWKKNALVLGRSPYQWMHEPCLYGWRADGKHQWYSDRKQTTIWEYDRPKANKDHPTMKPIGLMSYPIRNSTMTNGIVLDPFLGSGSTLIACEETERVCRGIELDPKFMDVIVKRYIEHQDGKYDDVYVIRDGQKLKFDEVATFEPETEVLADA